MGEAHVIIGGDAIVTASTEALSKIRSGMTRAVVASTLSPTSAFLRDPDWQFPLDACERQIDDALGVRADTIDAQHFATALLGDGIYANPFLLGYAWQQGWLPLMHASLMRAIELNGASVERNQQAFEWGRRSAHDRAAVERLITPAQVISLQDVKRAAHQAAGAPSADALDALLLNRTEFLVRYQNAAYAKRYNEVVTRVRSTEAARLGSHILAEAVARYLFKLMAYKDEYEVARLHADPAFMTQVQAQFEAVDTSKPLRLEYHLAPPLWSKHNSRGELVKQTYGGWVRHAFGVLARLRFLRGTVFDLFGATQERRTERASIDAYIAVVDELLAGLAQHNHALAVKIARIPEEIRGYGHVKSRHLEAAREHEAQLLAEFRGGPNAGNKIRATVHPLHAA
jgi:indolepyruvate ferredoxin oxidoreductase